MPQGGPWGSDKEIAIALRSSRRTVGLLGLGRSEGAFTPSDLDLLTIMAGQVAIALENASLYHGIHRSRDYVRAVLDSLHDEVIIIDRNYIVTDVNATFLRNMGYEREEVIGQLCYKISHRFEVPHGMGHPCLVDEVLGTGRSEQCLHVHTDRAGVEHYVYIAASPLRDPEGKIIGVIEAIRDVTAKWQLESILAVVRDLGRDLVLSRDEAEIARLVVNAVGKILNFDRCDLWLVHEDKNLLQLQTSSDPSLGAVISSLPLDSEKGITVAVARSGQAIYLPDTSQDPRYLSGGQDNRSELCVPLKVQDRVLGVLNIESPKVDAFSLADRQVLATLADQAALALENARLYRAVAQAEREWAETFDAITDGISIHDAEYRIVRVNRTLTEWLGLPATKLVGRTCCELFHHRREPLDVCPLTQVINTGRPQTVEVEEPTLGGIFQISVYPLRNGRGRVTGVVHIMRNITRRKQMEQELIQSEKLAALGRLAASLAHEINNPLQALRSGLGLLIKSSREDGKRRQYLRIAEHEVDRLIAITERMLSFYRPSAEQRRLTDLNSVLDEVLALADKKLQHSSVTLVCNLDRQLPLVEAVADQFRQVFLNIILNAVEAMPDGGELTVASGFDRRRREVWVSFADTGEGIPPESLSRIFEPLYSTKPQGTGLGLSISYSIVERHGGRIGVESRVGKGSTFTVFLPVGVSDAD